MRCGGAIGINRITWRALLRNRSPLTKLDRTGLLLSGLCLVHCAALPIAAVLLPSVAGLLLDHTNVAHWVLLGVAVPISGFALWRGVKHHGSKLGLGVGLFGMLVMALGVSHLFSTALEMPLTFFGASTVAVAHLINLRALNSAHASV